MRIPVFRVSNKTKLKPVSSATETTWKIEISFLASLDMILSNKRITKALIRLRGCASWPVFEKSPKTTKGMKNYPSCKELKHQQHAKLSNVQKVTERERERERERDLLSVL